MKRALVIGIHLVLFFAVASTQSQAQSITKDNKDTVAKAETGEVDPLLRMDVTAKADTTTKIVPMVKIHPHKKDGSTNAGVLPPPNGNDLAISCKADVEGFDAGYCLGVVEGVIASMKLCKQDSSVITLGEAADATAKYLASHPEKLKLRDAVLARKALSHTYPCDPSRR